MFSGGALLQLSVFALGIMPYITASIIIQVLRVVIPRFEALHKEGQQGQAKLNQYTRYLNIALSVLQATVMITLAIQGTLFGTQCLGVVTSEEWHSILLMVLTMTAGSSLIMWMGEQITESGIGNGMSLLIFTSIAATFPSSLAAIAVTKGIETLLVVLAVGILLVFLVVFVEQSQRRVPVQYARRMVGKRTYGGNNTYIPIKVNQAGVVPIIFASSLLYLPMLLVQFAAPADAADTPDWVIWVNTWLVNQNSPVYMVVYFFLTIAFAYFYVAITFNPEEVADNMKKYGGFIPGIRAGRPTAEYLSYVLSRITLPGSVYLAAIAMIPIFAFSLFQANQNFPFGGASILIMVGVGLDTVKQIDAQLQQRHYEGLLK
jgi:preprotein translocase subunit SecY